MTLKGSRLTPEACALWERRNAALEGASQLMSEKPDIDDWTSKDRRLVMYAMAIGHRLDRLN